jgi:FkbM family methyltransferase
MVGHTARHSSLFLGIVTNCSYYFELECASLRDVGIVAPALPVVSDHFWELKAIFLSIEAATENAYTFIEVGGGWGKWAVDAYFIALLSGRIVPSQISLLIAEAQPGHCQFAKQHLNDNGIVHDNNRIRVLCKAVHTQDDSELEFPLQTGNFGLSTFGVPGFKTIKVSTVMLDTLLKSYVSVDLLDLDIQGSEELVVIQAFRNSPCLLCDRVKMIVIGTHNHDVHDKLVQEFLRQKWYPVHNFRHATLAETELGPVKFNDGSICFLNLKFHTAKSH